MANRPTPTALKIVQGTMRKDRTNAAEPKPEVKLPNCPTVLNSEAKREWKRITKLLLKYGVATEFDFAALVTYCQMFGEYMTGIKNDEPVPIAHITQMRLLFVEFGMTPASRSRVNGADPKKDKSDPWDEI